MIYEGVLARSNPLYRFLSEEVLRQALGVEGDSHEFHITRLDQGGAVFRCFDEHTRADIVLKHYGRKWIEGDGSEAVNVRTDRARSEFWNLIEFRTLGLNCGPHLVPRPLAVSETGEITLVKEHIVGTTTQDGVHSVLRGAGTDGSSLREIVRDVAWFLKNLHTRSAGSLPVDRLEAMRDFEALIENLGLYGAVDRENFVRLKSLLSDWSRSEALSGGAQVLCVGDANFSNFIRTPAGSLALVDLEAAGWHDYAYDLGCVAAELKHLFLLHGLGAEASEDYISLLYRSYYGVGLPSQDSFARMTERGRFFMSLFELRMARNGWLELGHRQTLIREAVACLV